MRHEPAPAKSCTATPAQEKPNILPDFSGCLRIGRAHNNTELKQLTSYSYESIKPTLALLQHQGYIKRTEGKWQLCRSIY